MVTHALFKAERTLVNECNLGERLISDTKTLLIKGETLNKINNIFAMFTNRKSEMLSIFLDGVSSRYGYDYTEYRFESEDKTAITSIMLRKIPQEDYI